MGVIISGISLKGDGSALPITQGGTGATTATGAINNLLPSQASQTGKVLVTDGTNVSWQTVEGGTGGTTSAAGSAQQIQYNDGSGGFAASDDLYFDPALSMLYAENITGSGTNISNLDASNLITGTVPAARLGSGIADATVFLRGDGTWSSVTSAGSVAGNDTEVQFNSLGSVAASPDFSFDSATGTVYARTFSGSGGGLTDINASNISAGIVSSARLGTGSASASTYLRGDNTWSTITLSSSDLSDGASILKTSNSATITGNWSFSGTVSGSTPTLGSHLVTKTYVDSLAAGLKPHASVMVATTEDITLSGTQTIDGISVTSGKRVLVKDQTTSSQNGIYVSSTGAWPRATDFDGTGEVSSGDFVFVESGTENGASGWVVLTTGTITVGTTPIEFSKVSSSASGGTVTSVDIGGGTTGLTTTGGPVTDAGVIVLGGVLSTANGGTGNTITPVSGGIAYGSSSKIAYTSAGTTGQFLVSGGTGAPYWSSSGENLTNLNASNLTAGVVAVSRLGSGTASSSTYLRGDGTWSVVSPTQLTGTTNFGAPSPSASGLYAGLSLGTNNFPTIQFNASTAATDQKIWLLYTHSDGSINLTTPNDSRSGGTTALKISRSGTSVSNIELRSAAIDLIVGTGGLKLNGAVGTAGQVLTSNGTGVAPTWQAPSVSALSATAAMPAMSARGTFIGVQSSFPMIKLYQSGASAGNQVLFQYLDAGGNFKIAFDNGTTSTAFLSATRSSNVATDITLTATGINLAIGTGGLKLNGSAGTAGHVLTSNGTGAAPTWQAVSANALNATAASAPSGTVAGVYAGVSVSSPSVYMTNSAATTGNRAARFNITNSGEFKATLLVDNLSTETSFLSVTRSGTTASLMTLTATGINLAIGTGGLKLNGSAGTSGQVLMSNGASLAPTWASVPAGDASSLAGTTLASNVVSSSLTSVGTLTSVTVSGTSALGIVTTSGSVTATGQIIANGGLDFGKAYTEKTTQITASSTTNFDCSASNIFYTTLGTNITSITFSNLPASGKAYSMSIFITQDSTGGRTVAWPNSVKWPGSVAPTLTTAPTKTDVFSLITFDGGASWYGFTAGQNY